METLKQLITELYEFFGALIGALLKKKNKKEEVINVEYTVEEIMDWEVENMNIDINDRINILKPPSEINTVKAKKIIDSRLDKLSTDMDKVLDF